MVVYVSQTVKPKFCLNAQQCKYAKDDVEFPDASVRLLKDADLQSAFRAVAIYA